MKYLFLMTMGCLLYAGSHAQATHCIIDVNGKTTNIDSLQGKKILLIVLPVEKDTAMINQLLRFQNSYANRIQVIALVNTQPGAPSKEFYENAYNQVSTAGIMISEGIVPAVEVTDERAAVIQWITGRSNNRQEDRYITGSKYFLSEDGRLYAQVGKDVNLDAPIIKSIINTNVPKAVMRKSEEAKPATSPTPKL